MIRNGFALLFCGALLVTLDFVFGDFARLADLIGLATILSGLIALRQSGSRFRMAQPFAVGAITLACLAMINPDSAEPVASVDTLLSAIAAPAVFRGLCDAVVALLICDGIRRCAERTGRAALEAKAATRRNLVVAVALAGLFVRVCHATVGPAILDHGVVTLGLGALGIATLVLVLALIARAWRDLSGLAHPQEFRA